jgi:hypothetical protein
MALLTPPPQAAVGAELKKYGLRYDDLLDPTRNLVRRGKPPSEGAN